MKAHVLRSMLAVVLAATPVCTTVARVPKATGKNAAMFWPAADVFPGTAYDNAYQIPGATGKVNMIQPNGNVDVIFVVSVDGLTPNSRYVPHLDYTGIEFGNVATAGRWVEFDEFWTDENGHGEWDFIALVGTFPPGVYTYSVFINRTDVNYTVLISGNLVFKIADPEAAERTVETKPSRVLPGPERPASSEDSPGGIAARAACDRVRQPARKG